MLFIMGDLQFDFFSLVVVPILIILGRVIDVSLGTLKIILISKGYRSISAVLGFFESFIWIIVVSQIMKQLNNYYYYVAYGMGFALGTYLGVTLERYLSLGQAIIRVITRLPGDDLAQYLFDNNYTITKVYGEGKYGPVSILFLVVHRKQIDEVIQIIEEFNPKAFYTIEEVKSVSHLYVEKPKTFFNKLLNIPVFTQKK